MMAELSAQEKELKKAVEEEDERKRMVDRQRSEIARQRHAD
jgi:hypothetical protein